MCKSKFKIYKIALLINSKLIKIKIIYKCLKNHK